MFSLLVRKRILDLFDFFDLLKNVNELFMSCFGSRLAGTSDWKLFFLNA